MPDLRSPGDWRKIWRYYQAGVINTLFGYGLFAALLWIGSDVFVAQIVSHVLGTLFNYLTYSRYAFAGHAGSLWRFLASYAFNYALSLGCLWLVLRLLPSPYAAGAVTIVIVSLVNYFVLARFVFNRVVRG